MKKLIFFLPIVLIASEIPPSEYISTQEVKVEKDISHLGWIEDADCAIKKAKEENLPLLFAFVGPTWCKWSEKLQEEVLSTSAFLDPIKEKFVLVHIPFPENFAQFSAESLPALGLKDQYGVVECPTLVLTTSEGKKMTAVEYDDESPEAFAAQLLQLKDDFAVVEKYSKKRKLKHLDLATVKTVYEKAEKLGSSTPLKSIIKAGVKKDETSFFLLEKYKKIGESGRLFSHVGKRVRKKLLGKDPYNEAGTHREVAMIDFEALSEKDNTKIQEVISPLVSYLKNFGTSDPENAWRLEMKLSKYLFSKNQIDEALMHARSSLSMAPESKKEEIVETIQYLQTKL